MIRGLLQLLCLIALCPGCSERNSRNLGATFGGAPIPVASAKLVEPNSSVVVQGTMVEKCPEAGCWFVLRDASGAIKVDTRDAGFVVVDVPLQVPLAVAGRVTTNGATRILAATGLRY